jgi:retinitis pigmentosa 1
MQGVRLPVTKARYKTIDSLMDDLSSKMNLSFGVRRVFTPMGRREVKSMDELQHMGR